MSRGSNFTAQHDATQAMMREYLSRRLVQPGAGPTTTEICEALQISERTCQRHIAELAKAGFITRGGRGRSISTMRLIEQETR